MPTAIPGTVGAISPVFSPDSESIAFSLNGKLRTFNFRSSMMSPPLADFTGTGESWGDDGSIVYSPGIRETIHRISVTGGTPQSVTTFDASRHEITHRAPQFLPGANALLFLASSHGGNYNDADIFAQDLKTGRRTLLHHGGYAPRYVGPPKGSGFLLFIHDRTLYAKPMDPVRLAVTEPAVPTQQGDFGFLTSGSVRYAHSQTGLFAFGNLGDLDVKPLVWLTEGNRPAPLVDQLAIYVNPRFSPDGTRIAFVIREDLRVNIWVYEIARKAMSRLTFDEGAVGGDGSYFFAWTPDSRHIVFTSADGPVWLRADGAGKPALLRPLKVTAVHSISPDGRHIALTTGAGQRVVQIAELEGASTDQPKMGTPQDFTAAPIADEPSFSPDGRWLAYHSRESGTNEVYVRAFPDKGGKWIVSKGGGTIPRWSKTGNQIFYLNNDRHIVAVPYSIRGDAFVPGTPRLWSNQTVSAQLNPSNYDVAPDGKRPIAVGRSIEDDGRVSQLNLIVSFSDELRRRTAPAK